MDWRLKNICVYCGAPADTLDHVPSRCFLDEPYPDNLRTVQCCEKCNHKFSPDEEYVSCLIDCMKEKTTNPAMIKREKTRKTLSHSPMLLDRITKQHRMFAGIDIYDMEKSRLDIVIHKLAFGHLAYENSSINWDSEYKFNMWLIETMPKNLLEDFEMPYNSDIAPEIGSNCFSKDGCIHVFDGLDKPSINNDWIVVQDGRYRYCVSPDSTKVKFVIAEYLAVEVLIVDNTKMCIFEN